MQQLKVTCAIVLINEKVLVVQRSEVMNLPLKWEFPGGKLEDGESEIDCIRREIKEELNIEIDVIERLTPSVFQYPNMMIELIPFTANYIEGELKIVEHKQCLLLDKHELVNLDWAEADLPILKEFLEL